MCRFLHAACGFAKPRAQFAGLFRIPARFGSPSRKRRKKMKTSTASDYDSCMGSREAVNDPQLPYKWPIACAILGGIAGGVIAFAISTFALVYAFDLSAEHKAYGCSPIVIAFIVLALMGASCFQCSMAMAKAHAKLPTTKQYRSVTWLVFGVVLGAGLACLAECILAAAASAFQPDHHSLISEPMHLPALGPERLRENSLVCRIFAGRGSTGSPPVCDSGGAQRRASGAF